MIFTSAKYGFLILLFLVHGQCGTLERDNPLDPGGQFRQTTSAVGQSASDPSALSLRLPLPKALLGVVDSVVAILEGPDIQPVVKQLSISPLGPATGILGALQPGSGRTLTIEGFDLQGNLIFTGQERDITISVGDTTSVQIELRLTQPLPADGGDPSGDDTPDDSGTDPNTGTESDATDQGDSGAGDASEEDSATDPNTGTESDATDQGDSGAGDASGEDSATDPNTGTEDDSTDQGDSGAGDASGEDSGTDPNTGTEGDSTSQGDAGEAETETG